MRIPKHEDMRGMIRRFGQKQLEELRGLGGIYEGKYTGEISDQDLIQTDGSRGEKASRKS